MIIYVYIFNCLTNPPFSLKLIIYMSVREKGRPGIISIFCPQGQFVPILEFCPRFVPGLRKREQIVPRPRWHWPQASFYRKNREGRSGYLSLILSLFVPRRQIRICLKASHRAARGQNGLICPLKRLYAYTLIHIPPIIEESGDKIRNLSPGRTMTGLSAGTNLSPVLFDLFTVPHFVHGPLYDWPHGGDKFVPVCPFCLLRFVPWYCICLSNSVFCPMYD